MAKQIQVRRGTTAQHATFTGANGELSVDTDKKSLVLHDGVTVGGHEIPSFAVLGDKLVQYTPMAYPLATPPTGYLMLMGQTISAVSYPILYSLYGATLPDLRGVFIRGWDNGRGYDTGRAMLSYQADAIRNITGDITVYTSYISADNKATGAFTLVDGGGNGESSMLQSTCPKFVFNASNVVPTAADNRPRNVAFNYIVKAG